MYLVTKLKRTENLGDPATDWRITLKYIIGK
jgi:hypothetical protein